MKFPHLCLSLLVLTSACKQNREIQVYRVAKESASDSQSATPAGPQATMPGTMPGGAMPGGAAGADPHAGMGPDQLGALGAGGAPRIADTPPANWKKQAPTAMRQASYLVTGEDGAATDISLVILRGAAGGTLDNVNRWRGQLGQPPIDETALKQSSQTIETPVGQAVAVEIEGLAAGADAKKDGRLIGVIADKDGDAWFYKMRGNSALTAAEKDNFLKWVLSVKPEAPAASPPAAAAPAQAPAAPAQAAAGAGELSWQVPAGWTLAPTASSMRYATFAVVGADGAKGEMAVSHFPGDVGGDLENVNRWRQQVGLGPVDAAGMAPLVSQVMADSQKISVIDVTGPQTRLAAGWTRHGPDTWFFKLTGPDSLVGAEKAKFTAFLESVRFNKPE